MAQKADITALVQGNAARGAQLIERLGRGRNAYQDVTWPGGNLVIRLRLLTCSQIQAALGAALTQLKEVGIEPGIFTHQELAAEEIVQRLYLAMRDPTTGDVAKGTEERLFESADQVRDLLHEDERLWLYKAYQQLESASDPAIEDLDDETYLAIDEAIKKKDVRRLSGFAPASLVSYLLTTDSRPSISPTGRSSSSSRSSELPAATSDDQSGQQE